MNETDIRRETRQAVIAVLKDEIDGGELVCKEVFEACAAKEEVAVVLDELHEIINAISKIGVIDDGED